MRPSTTALLSAAALAVSAVPAAAEGWRGVAPPAYGEAGRYGYAGDFVQGSYIGAPLTRVPSPNRIVPTPWSYGTYGVPTVTGIPAAPVAAPTLTVIDGGRAARSGAARAGRDAAEGREAGIRVIQVRVPRR